MICRALHLFAQRNEIREQTVSARHAGGKLTEKSESGVNVISLAVSGDEQPTLERRFTWIVEGENRREMRFVPRAGKIGAAFLNPVFKIGGGNFVRHIER